MTPDNRRRIVWAVLAVLAVLGLWRCVGELRSDDDTEALTVFGPWLDDEALAFDAVLDDFTDDTGIAVDYVGSSDFDGDLRERISGGLALPDVAVIPQPALFAELIVIGVIDPLADETVDAIIENFDVDRGALEVFDGDAYLAPYRSNLKSLVWYRPDVWEDNGWTVPTSLDELRTLVDEIAESDDGIAPWCFSIEAGPVSGWAATDWIEDLVLRDAGVEAYVEWSLTERAFGDDAIRSAISDFGDLVLAPGHVAGGTQRVVSTPVENASAPLFGPEPSCAMYKQASFAVNWFPADTEVGPDADVDFFVLPGAAGEEPPLLVGSDSLVQFDDRPEVVELMTYLMTVDGVDAWLERGDFLSGRTSVDADDLDPLDARFTEILTGADEIRTDASDNFPSAIRDLFLDELTDYIAETNYLDSEVPLDRLLETMDAAVAALDEAETEAEADTAAAADPLVED